MRRIEKKVGDNNRVYGYMVREGATLKFRSVGEVKYRLKQDPSYIEGVKVTKNNHLRGCNGFVLSRVPIDKRLTSLFASVEVELQERNKEFIAKHFKQVTKEDVITEVRVSPGCEISVQTELRDDRYAKGCVQFAQQELTEAVILYKVRFKGLRLNGYVDPNTRGYVKLSFARVVNIG